MPRSFLSAITNWGGVFLLAVVLLAPAAGRGALLYKDYLLRTDRGEEILCDTYVVQPDDWVYKILRLRGEIAHQDFPEFLKLFRRLNPDVGDINTIRPGQQILIPLRVVRREELPLSDSGTVTIPFVDASGRAVSGDSGAVYVVQRGDCISKLLAGISGAFGSAAYRQAETRFRRLNPQVTDLNRIYAGQRLVLAESAPADRPVPEPGPSPEMAKSPPSGLARLAEWFDARLMNQGKYFFPRPGGSDIAVDLARYPLVSLPDGTRLLLAGDSPPPEEVLAAARQHWPRLMVVAASADAAAEDQVDLWMSALGEKTVNEPLNFVDNGVAVAVRSRWRRRIDQGSEQNPRFLCITPITAEGQRTPEPIQSFLETHGIRLKEIVRPETDAPAPAVATGRIPVPEGATLPRVLHSMQPRQFVAELLPALGFVYAADVPITFPYAGLQIQAVSNVVHRPRGGPLFIDFGTLYGEAFSAIEATGFRILRIDPDMAPGQIVEKLLTVLEVPFEKHPTFLAAARPAQYNTELKLPGILRPATTETAGQLITTAELDERLRHFLSERRIGVISYPGASVFSEQASTRTR